MDGEEQVSFNNIDLEQESERIYSETLYVQFWGRFCTQVL